MVAKLRKNRALSDTIASLLVLLFVYAAVTKWLEYEKFKVQLGQSPLLSPFAGLVAIAIPAVEIITAVLLLTTRFQRLGLYVSFGLLVMFSAYIIAITRFSSHVPCSCGGVLETMGWTAHLIFNLAFTALTAVALLLNGNDTQQPLSTDT